MKFSDFVLLKPIQSPLVPTNGIEANTNIFSLSDERIRKLPPILDIVDAAHATAGTIDREMLIFLRDTCSSSRLLSMLEDAPIGVVAINDSSRIFYANRAYSHIIGVKKQSVIGKYMRALEPSAAILDVLDSKESSIVRTVWINSVKRYVRVNISPLARDGEKWGAISFFTDVTENARLAVELDHARGLADHFRQELETQSELPKSFVDIIGKDPQFLRILQTAGIAAKTDVPLLIQGENGVGKEVLARAIHTASPRSDAPFITVNCAAIPDNLLESELFGYEEGAFTGAKRGGALGKFELAEGGVLFLDEIGDMPPAMQAKLLRALQQKEIEKIGRSKTITVDVRIIAATNKNLDEMVKSGEFRSDLFYRLNVVTILIPPLRERPGDIGRLAQNMIDKYNKKYEKTISISKELHDILQVYPWPGNIRELANVLEYSVIMCPGPLLLPKHLPSKLIDASRDQSASPLPVPNRTWKEVIGETERNLIKTALSASNGNRSEAIRRLGMSRRAFYAKIKQYNLF